jgi:hypothetical protein
MNEPLLLYGWLTPESLATYLSVFLGIILAAWQLNRTLRMNKKANLFDEITKDISLAVNNINSINIQNEEIIKILAKQANLVSEYDPTNKTDEQNQAEIARRLSEIDDTGNKHRNNVQSIFDSYSKILEIISTIEKSTVIRNKSKMAARQLYYTSTEQYELVHTVNQILLTFYVFPPLGGFPNVTSETFNSFAGLVKKIGTGNDLIKSYLQDLEVILHNDLVKRFYGKARYGELNNKYLTSDGLKDRRVLDKLI